MEMQERPIKEFRDSGLLWFVNRMLHVFGWAIAYEQEDDGTITRWYPVRVTYRGFPQETEEENFERVARYMEENSSMLYAEAGYSKKPEEYKE